MSNNSKTKMLKKGIYTPAKAQLNAAPANKAEYTSNTENKGKFSKKESEKEAINRRRDKLFKDVLIRRKVPKEDIESIPKENYIVLCRSYGSYTVEDGVREIKKKNKATETVPNILRGTSAIVHLIRETFKQDMNDNKIKIVHVGSLHVCLSIVPTLRESVETCLKPVGRISLWKKPISQPPKPKKNKKPSNNTEEAKKNAKNERKESKQAANDMRPYYAARRNMKKGASIKKAISKRIRMHNPTLAADIEAWLAKNPIDTKKRVGHAAKKGSHQFHNNVTSLQMKRSEHMKKEQQRIATLKKMKATQATKMASNQAKRNASKKPVQTELKMAA